MAKSYQVFVGCPFLTAIRKNYDKLKSELEEETPLHIVLADTTAISSTDYLLEHITNLIRESAACVFDVTGGNPNVSVEVGIAHALPADFLLALYTRKPRSQRDAEETLQREGELRPIISDLQGRNRIEYKTYRTLKLLSELIEAGKVRPQIDRRYPFAEIPAAIAYLEQGRARGKVVVGMA
jgi:NADPH:quinone reductase-like Zn-dependent oxidoreductase